MHAQQLPSHWLVESPTLWSLLDTRQQIIHQILIVFGVLLLLVAVSLTWVRIEQVQIQHSSNFLYWTVLSNGFHSWQHRRLPGCIHSRRFGNSLLWYNSTSWRARSNNNRNSEFASVDYLPCRSLTWFVIATNLACLNIIVIQILKKR